MHLSELLEELGIKYFRQGEHHHCSANFLQVECPWCSSRSGKFRMGLHQHFLYAHCWTCGSHPLQATLKEIVSGSSASRIALNGLYKQLDRERVLPPTHRGQLVLPQGVGDLKRCHRDFLRERGIDPDEVSRLWGVQGIGLAPKLAWRVFIPIHHCGEVVSWTTRSVSTSGSGAKYITARPDQEKYAGKSTLSGFDAARAAVIIVEGPLDRLRIGPGAVDTGGAAYTQDQLLQMTRFPVRYVAYDMDETGLKQGEKLVRELSAYPGKTSRVFLDAKDPGECSEKEIKQLRRLLK